MKHTLTEIVKSGIAKISHVCAGRVYFVIKVDSTIYQLEINSMDDEWISTYIYPEFKVITLMRWIRDAIDNKTDKFIQLN